LRQQFDSVRPDSKMSDEVHP